MLFRIFLFFFKLYIKFLVFLFWKSRDILLQNSVPYQELDAKAIQKLHEIEENIERLCQYPFVRNASRNIIHLLQTISDFPLTPRRVSKNINSIIQFIQIPFIKSIKNARKEPSSQSFSLRKRTDSLRSLESVETTHSLPIGQTFDFSSMKSPAKSF